MHFADFRLSFCEDKKRVQEKTQANPTQNSRICICICASLSVRIYFGFTACNYPGKEEPENTENTECFVFFGWLFSPRVLSLLPSVYCALSDCSAPF